MIQGGIIDMYKLKTTSSTIFPTLGRWRHHHIFRIMYKKTLIERDINKYVDRDKEERKSERQRERWLGKR